MIRKFFKMNLLLKETGNFVGSNEMTREKTHEENKSTIPRTIPRAIRERR